ncbi:Sulfate permease [Luteococcus japonicus LSP_Lj1]|uniref:Sulfate permease n=1 Tax=Luteococcus japonicus LSP_Lj1 TaxID=1255658 RepID=A0A1R4JSE6_9ACTN|nr:Sulfate permease [Luteococcus japonicus LSP_Lj1]
MLPGLDVLAHYRREWLRGDVLGGITVAAYLVPQVMAYAVVAGLPPVAGLWASGVPLVVYALMGSSRQLSVGPESTTALMTAAGVAALAGQGAGHPPDELAAALAFAVGLVCLAGYLLRLGFLAALLSRPVLVGYMSGVAVMMITSQLGKVSRLGVQGERPDQEIWWWITHLGSAHRPTLALALLVLVLLFAARRLLPTWPGPLLVMVAAALVVWLADLQAHGIRTIGAVPAGLPRAALPSPDGLPLGALVRRGSGHRPGGLFGQCAHGSRLRGPSPTGRGCQPGIPGAGPCQPSHRSHGRLPRLQLWQPHRPGGLDGRAQPAAQPGQRRDAVGGDVLARAPVGLVPGGRARGGGGLRRHPARGRRRVATGGALSAK